MRAVSSVVIRPRGIAAPITNAPNTACSPIRSVNHAPRAMDASAIARPASDNALSLAQRVNARRSSGRSNPSVTATKPMPPLILRMALFHCLSKLASTMASRHHAAASSIAPAPIATVPMVVPLSFLKWMILASIGNAVMHIEAPRNTHASKRLVF